MSCMLFLKFVCCLWSHGIFANYITLALFCVLLCTLLTLNDEVCTVLPGFVSFRTLSCDEVRNLINHVPNKLRYLDPIPVTCLKQPVGQLTDWSILVMWLECRFLDTEVDGLNPGISMLFP